MSIAAGGGWLFGGFVMLAVPLGLLLAAPPTVGRYVGRMRASADITTWYAVCTVGVWVGCLTYGLVITTETVGAPGGTPTREILIAVGAIWIAQVTAGALARRRTSAPPTTDPHPGVRA